MAAAARAWEAAPQRAVQAIDCLLGLRLVRTLEFPFLSTFHPHLTCKCFCAPDTTLLEPHDILGAG